MCGANARPTDELALARGGGGEQRGRKPMNKIRKPGRNKGHQRVSSNQFVLER